MGCLYKTILFDVDGTLFDTEKAITTSIKATLKEFGIDPPTDDELKTWIGPPFRETIRQYNLDEKTYNKLTDRQRENYGKMSIGNIKMYDGVVNLLEALSKEDVFISTASSKWEESIRVLFEEFGITKYFDDIVGCTFDGSIDGKEQVLDELYRRNDIEIGSTVLIGDRKYDAKGAEYKNIDFIGCLYGFGTYEELSQFNSVTLVSTAEELEKYLIY